MSRMSAKFARSIAIATLVGLGVPQSSACGEAELVHLFPTDHAKTTSFCLAGHCLKRGQIHYDNEVPTFPPEELPQAVATIPTVLAFLEGLSKHKTVAEWCIALKSTAELRRPLFCDKPEAVVGAIPQEAQPFKSLVISWNGLPGDFSFSVSAHKRGACEKFATIRWDATNGQIAVDNPTDLVNFFFKRSGCKLVQPPVAAYDPTYWSRRGMTTSPN